MNDLMQMFDEKNNGRTRTEEAPNKKRCFFETSLFVNVLVNSVLSVCRFFRI